MSLCFIFMLTRHDRTVTDAFAHLQSALNIGVRHIGFKDIGLPFAQLRQLNKRVKDAGATSYLEVVSLDPEDELTSARAAVEIGIDVLLGGTHVDDVLPILKESGVQYCPYAGSIAQHPNVLCGSTAEIVASAKALALRDGVNGLDLLAYRSKSEHIPSLIEAVCESVAKPVYVAGSIDTPEKITHIKQGGAAGFTIGTAALDGRYPAADKEVPTQLAAIIRDVANLNHYPPPRASP